MDHLKEARWTGKVAWSLLSRVASALLTFMMSFLLARSMSKGDVGLYFWIFSLCSGVALGAQWGGTILAVKWVAQSETNDPGRAASAAISLVAMALCHALLAALLVLIFAPTSLAGPAAIWLISITLQLLTAEIVRGTNDIKWASLLAGPLPQMLTVVLLVALWAFGTLNFNSAAIATSGSGLCASGIGWWLLSRRMARPSKLITYFNLLREGAPIATTLIVNFLFVQIDLWICGYRLGPESAAGYAMGQRFTAFISMAMMTAGSVLLPTLAAMSSRPAETRPLMWRATKLCFAASGLAFIAIAVIGKEGFAAILGSNYRESHTIFLILGAGQLFHAMAGPNGYLLLVSGGERVVMWSNLVSSIILLFCGPFAATIYGTSGLAIVATACLAIQTIWMWIVVKRKFFSE